MCGFHTIEKKHENKDSTVDSTPGVEDVIATYIFSSRFLLSSNPHKVFLPYRAFFHPCWVSGLVLCSVLVS